jgi:hypothetical protein
MPMPPPGSWTAIRPDLVLDFLWGTAAEAAFSALARQGLSRVKPRHSHEYARG